ncbi:MAG: DUF1993 family protein [Gammaproteobacteria bacterium]
MSISLHDVSVVAFRQVLAGVAGFLEKARNHCVATGLDTDEIVAARLAPDMYPFRFQIAAVAHHSLGALRGIEAGVFGPPNVPELDYAGLQGLIADAQAGLAVYTPEAVNALTGRDLEFRLGDNRIPFIAEHFVLSFSLPNLHFHATTAYDILRMKGVPLGKRDYLAQLRIKR